MRDNRYPPLALFVFRFVVARGNLNFELHIFTRRQSDIPEDDMLIKWPGLDFDVLDRLNRQQQGIQ